MERIVFLDWDAGLVQSITPLLLINSHAVFPCRGMEELYDCLNKGAVDLVVLQIWSDWKEALRQLAQIHRLDPDVAMVFMADELDFDLAGELMRYGAADCVRLPLEPDVLAARIETNLTRSKEKTRLKKAELEQLCVDLESQQIMSWRAMYASKEVIQAEHLIHEMATTINSTGGYEWMDLLAAMSSAGNDGQMLVPKDIYDLILESAGAQRKFFDFITFLSRLDKMTFNKTEHSAVLFATKSEGLVRGLLNRLASPYGRDIKTAFPEAGTWISGYVCQDMEILERCFRELVVNAIKYSPDGGPLMVGIDIEADARMPILNLWIRNVPRKYQAKDSQGKNIIGIPLEYSELVFDLFYTIEAYPNKLSEEEWTDGSGLYIARKLLKRQGAWLSTANGVDYTGLKAEHFVKFNISIPLHAKRDFERCTPKCSPCPFMLLKKH